MGPALRMPPVHRDTGSKQYTCEDRLWARRAGGLCTRQDLKRDVGTEGPA